MSIPTDEQILKYDKVPVSVAAKYLGCNPDFLRSAMANGSCPFGFFTKRKERSFHISPGMLVAYKRGHLILHMDNDWNFCPQNPNNPYFTLKK